MSGTHERARLLALARAAEPPPLAGTDARRLLRRALLAGGARRQRRAERRGWLLSAAGGLALLGALALLHAWRAAGPLANHAGTARSEPPLELRLPAGDRLLATPGARFDLLRTTQQQREISLRGGTLAFEVVALAGDERFAVVTPHLRAQVRGTVFTVEVDAQRTRVRVYEGAVAVSAAAGGERVLHAGQRYASDGDAQTPDPLQPQARALAEQRRRSAAAAPAQAPAAAARTDEPGAIASPGASAAPAAQVSLEQARAFLHGGEPERALTAARMARASGPPARGAWLLLEGDAQRALERPQAAHAAYAEAARASSGPERAVAGWKAADLALRALDDPRAALHTLDRAAVDAPGSALRERGLLLRIEARLRLGHEVESLAAAYLAEYPDSAGAAELRARTGQ